MIIIKCDATDCENNFDGECTGCGETIPKYVHIEHGMTGSGFYPICQDYKEKD